MSEREEGRGIPLTPDAAAIREMRNLENSDQQRYDAYVQYLHITETEALAVGPGVVPVGHEMNPVGIEEFLNWEKKVAGRKLSADKRAEGAQAADRARQEEFVEKVDRAIAEGNLSQFFESQRGQNNGARKIDAEKAKKIGAELKQEMGKDASSEADSSGSSGERSSWSGGMQSDKKGKPNEKKGIMDEIKDWFKGLFGG